MTLFYLLALHIIFIVTWFAGLFYIVRLFIYHTEAETKPEPERSILQNQFKIMESRLWYGITWPSMILTLIFGGTLLYTRWQSGVYSPILQNSWLIIKLSLVAGLIAYQFYCERIIRQLKKGVCKHSSSKLRILNEVATVFLVAIVFIVKLKSAMSMLWGLIGLILFSALLLAGIVFYRKIRNSNQ